jgi:hypothetical protein
MSRLSRRSEAELREDGRLAKRGTQSAMEVTAAWRLVHSITLSIALAVYPALTAIPITNIAASRRRRLLRPYCQCVRSVLNTMIFDHDDFDTQRRARRTADCALIPLSAVRIVPRKENWWTAGALSP